MIKRMLKKKIHPEIDTTKAFKKDVPYKPTRKCESLESFYLLNIQGSSFLITYIIVLFVFLGKMFNLLISCGTDCVA